LLPRRQHGASVREALDLSARPYDWAGW
jgi:hypothetical protein